MQFVAVLFVALMVEAASSCPALASDQAKAIVESIDPNLMNQLVEAARNRSDVSLANIVPVSGNKYRFLYIWPSSYQQMTQERIGQSFVQRFLLLADQQRLLANGYCLLSEGISFGTTSYADQELNVAYRDIEVRYLFGSTRSCAGHYIAAADFFKDLNTPDAVNSNRQGMLSHPRQK